jgi:hypothetical protein
VRSAGRRAWCRRLAVFDPTRRNGPRPVGALGRLRPSAQERARVRSMKPSSSTRYAETGRALLGPALVPGRLRPNARRRAGSCPWRRRLRPSARRRARPALVSAVFDPMRANAPRPALEAPSSTQCAQMRRVAPPEAPSSTQYAQMNRICCRDASTSTARVSDNDTWRNPVIRCSAPGVQSGYPQAETQRRVKSRQSSGRGNCFSA